MNVNFVQLIVERGQYPRWMDEIEIHQGLGVRNFIRWWIRFHFSKRSPNQLLLVECHGKLFD